MALFSLRETELVMIDIAETSVPFGGSGDEEFLLMLALSEIGSSLGRADRLRSSFSSSFVWLSSHLRWTSDFGV